MQPFPGNRSAVRTPLCSDFTKQTLLSNIFFLPLPDLRSLPCPVPPGFLRGLWTAQSEPSHRCPTLLGQRSTEPPTKRACPTSGQNMVPTTKTVEEERWPIGTWPLDPQVRLYETLYKLFSNFLSIKIHFFRQWLYLTHTAPAPTRELPYCCLEREYNYCHYVKSSAYKNFSFLTAAS